MRLTQVLPSGLIFSLADGVCFFLYNYVPLLLLDTFGLLWISYGNRIRSRPKPMRKMGGSATYNG